MSTWRLVAHHKQASEAVLAFRRAGRIAIGWTDVGDLRTRRLRNASDISALVKRHHPDVVNAHLGGPSLWRFFDQMQPDDLVIISGDGRRQHVMRVIGPYNWDRQGIMGYGHWRAATSVAIDPDELWRRCGSRPAAGENIRWTLFRCLRSASE